MPHDVGTLLIPPSIDETLGSSQPVLDTKKNLLFHPLALLGYPPRRVFLYLALKYNQFRSGLGLVLRLNKFLNSKRDMVYLYIRHNAIAQITLCHALEAN